MAIFPLVQFEFTHSLGPAPGRYVIVPDEIRERESADPRSTGASPPASETAPFTDELRAKGSADVLVLSVLGAPPASGRRLLSRRAKSVDADPTPAEVALALATVIRATAELSEPEAEAWLERLRDDWREREQYIDEALAILNEVVTAHRVTAHDPYATDLARVDPRAIRVGWGEADLVAAGRWSAAIVAPAPREGGAGAAASLASSLAMTSILTGRTRALDAEELLTRAILDLDHGRPRAAAFQLAAALDCARQELAGYVEDDGDVQAALAEAERLLASAGSDAGLGRNDAGAGALTDAARAVSSAIKRWRKRADPDLEIS